MLVAQIVCNGSSWALGSLCTQVQCRIVQTLGKTNILPIRTKLFWEKGGTSFPFNLLMPWIARP